MDIHSFEPIFGSWYLEETLGKGSYGEVYRARKQDAGTTFYSAIKHVTITDNGEIPVDQQLDSLNREISINYQLRGETHFVSFEDSQVIPTPDGSGADVFIRMELLTCLTQRIKEQPLSEQEVAQMGIEICSALSLLEKKKIIHRDIKPANIFISDSGHYKLGDFGVARSLGATTGGMTIAGAFNYMAPEIYKGELVNHTADIYSLGLVLYRLLNDNRTPFAPPPPTPITFDTENTAFVHRMNGDPLPAPTHASPAMAAVLSRACAYTPQARFPSAQAFADALAAVAQGGAAPVYGDATVSVPGGFQGQLYAPHTDTHGQHSQTRTRKFPLWAVAVIAIAAVIAIVAFTMAYRQSRSDDDGSATSLSSSTSTENTTNASTAVYTITATASAGGSISPAGSLEVEDGQTQTFTVHANSGFSIASVHIDGVEQDILDSYQLKIDGADRSISVTFAETDDTTSASSGSSAHEYTIMPGDFSVSDAQGYAASMGMYLAVPNSTREMERFLEIAAETAEAQGLRALMLGGGIVHYDDGSWAGYWDTGEDFFTEDSWWLDGEPNNTSGVDGVTEDRIALWRYEDRWGLIDAQADLYTLHPGEVGFLLEKDA